MSGYSSSSLSDCFWKNSFDMLMEDRKHLREKKIIKQKVRTSYNNDSSIEEEKIIRKPPKKKTEIKIKKHKGSEKKDKNIENELLIDPSYELLTGSTPEKSILNKIKWLISPIKELNLSEMSGKHRNIVTRSMIKSKSSLAMRNSNSSSNLLSETENEIISIHDSTEFSRCRSQTDQSIMDSVLISEVTNLEQCPQRQWGKTAQSIINISSDFDSNSEDKYKNSKDINVVFAYKPSTSDAHKRKSESFDSIHSSINEQDLDVVAAHMPSTSDAHKRNSESFDSIHSSIHKQDIDVEAMYMPSTSDAHKRKSESFDSIHSSIHEQDIEMLTSNSPKSEMQVLIFSKRSINKSIPVVSTTTFVEQSKYECENPPTSRTDGGKGKENLLNAINVSPKSRNTRKRLDKTIVPVNANDLDSNNTDEQLDDFDVTDIEQIKPVFKAGNWRRSISTFKKTILTGNHITVEKPHVDTVNITKPSEFKESIEINRKQYSNDSDDLQYYQTAYHRRTVFLNGESVFYPTELSDKEKVLRRCGQSEPLDFDEVYSESKLKHCRKIGEGVYGEVFLNKTKAGQAVILKIVPIEGQIVVNGEQQKSFGEIFSEIAISLELSSLRSGGSNYYTSGFVEVYQVRCVRGRYPVHLLDLWELYKDNYGTENDSPEIFSDDQLYIVLELSNAGQNLETFQFNNAIQTYSVLQQIALILAVAEQKYQFEHRDLHWGNILISLTDEKEIKYKLNNEQICIPSNGVKVTIIDYTLSRIVADNCILFNDLAHDDSLFSASGDYQFEIYCMMRKSLLNKWDSYEPCTNVFWLHYINDKMINGVRYKYTKTRKHQSGISALMIKRDQVLDCKNAHDVALLLAS